MYGRRPRTLFATWTNVREGVSEAAFRSWFEDVHGPDSFELGLFDALSRQRAASPSRAEWLALWEAEYPDTASALEKIRPAAGTLREQGRILPVVELIFQQFLQRVDVDSPLDAGRVRSLTTLQNDWSRPAADQGFDAWWREAVLACAPPLELHHARYAYAAFDLEDESAGKFLVLLESERAPEALARAWRGCGSESLTPFGPPAPVYPEPGVPPRIPARGDASGEARRALHVVHWSHDSDAVSSP